MTYMQKVGNLKFYYRENAPHDVTIYAINGTDIVASEVYFTDIPADGMRAMLKNRFDTFALRDISAAMMDEIRMEYNGNLISGILPGWVDREYFKRIDDTPYFKHFTHRPMMEEATA